MGDGNLTTNSVNNQSEFYDSMLDVNCNLAVCSNNTNLGISLGLGMNEICRGS